MYEIERRTILWKMPLAAAAFIAAVPEALRANNAPTTWDDFTARTTAIAKELYDKNGFDDEAYVYRIASAAIGAPDVPPNSKTGKFGKLDPPVEFGPVYRGAPLFIVQWKLAPNAWLPPHNHPNYDVVTVGLEGEAVITHYEIDGDAPPFDSKTPFTVRKTRETLIAQRRSSPLTWKHDNIHTFRAGSKGARGIDIGTLVTKDVGFSFLDIDAKTADAARNTFAAKWAGQEPPVR
jgi:hypothetical protein